MKLIIQCERISKNVVNLKPRAIVAEDEEHIRDLLSYMLESIGFEVIAVAENGQRALELLQKEKPDLAILDINMPHLKGTEVLKKYNCTKDVCIIMLTALSDTDTVKECVSLGVSYFIRKDTPVPKMIEIIKNTWKAFYGQKSKFKYNLDKIISEIEEDSTYNISEL
jgi:DNA-binding response OmpR family regulator